MEPSVARDLLKQAEWTGNRHTESVASGYAFIVAQFNWAALSPQQRYRFIGGRNHFQRLRRWRAAMRRSQVHKLVASNQFPPAAYVDRHAYHRALALELGVSERTIYRDLAALRAQPVCPVCGKPRD